MRGNSNETDNAPPPQIYLIISGKKDSEIAHLSMDLYFTKPHL